MSSDLGGGSSLSGVGGVLPQVNGSAAVVAVATQAAGATTLRPPGAGRPYNGTGHFLDNDELDPSEYHFTETQTLFLACFATLVPLVLSLITVFVLRYFWRKYKRGDKDCNSAYDGVAGGPESSSDHVTSNQTNSGNPLHSHLITGADQNNQICEGSIAEGDEGSSSPVMYSGSSSRTNHASANGSIITMTLKNNHLIVETEERNDIIEDSRETTMKYSPSAKDGVFVVEVQQGVRREGNNSPIDINDQTALVHNPPDKFNDQDTAPPKSISTLTGLSQSNSSLNQPPSYRYGNQQGYDNGYYGYPVYNGYINNEMIIPPLNNRPIIKGAVYKENGRLSHGMSIDMDGQQILLSDIQARETAENRQTARQMQNSGSQDSQNGVA